MKLFDLSQQLLRNLPEFALLKAAFNVCQHVKITCTLPLKLSTDVEDAARSPVKLIVK